MPWEWALLIWLFAFFLEQVTDDREKMLNKCIMVLSLVALAVNGFAIIYNGRTRENLMYARDNIFAFVFLILIVQIFDFLSMHEVFGPWSVIIASLVMDVVKFLIVLLLFIGAFSMHMCVIYKPAYNKARVDMPTKLTNFGIKGDFINIFEELFFTCFGHTNRPTKLTAIERNNNPEETYNIATFVFALYEILAIIVLINLLIAMMSNTYTIIDERSETEWKFGRARLIWYMTKTTSVPIPINMISVLITVAQVVFKTKCLCCTANVNNLYHNMSGSGKGDEEAASTGVGPQHIGKVVPWKEVVKDYKLYSELSED